jgi:transposase
MQKKYIVRLSESEHQALEEIVKTLSGSSQKVRRAQILLKADIERANWSDQSIADAYHCRRQTVENLRRRLVEDGFEVALNGKPRSHPPTEKLLDGEQEAQAIATRLGPPPKGYSTWSLRLLARKVVELGITETVSHETVRQTLKKTV